MHHIELGGNSKGNDMIRERLSVVVNEYKISLDTVHKATGVDLEWLSNYISEKTTLDTLPMDKYGRLFDVIAVLSDGVKLVDDDERIKGIIDVLVQLFGVTFAALSAITGLEQQEIEQFTQNPSTLDYEKKYNLATKSLFLHYVFKDPASGV